MARLPRMTAVPLCLALLAGCGESVADEGSAPPDGAGAPDERDAATVADDVPAADDDLEDVPIGSTDPDAGTAGDEHPPDPDAWEPLTEFEGVPVETIREYHPNGRLASIRTVDPTIEGPEGFHGPELGFFQNGLMRLRQVWVKGSLEGEAAYWYNTGTLRWRCTLRGGERDGVYEEFHRNSDPKARFEYVDKRAHGSFLEWFVENEPHTESYWENGVQVGVHRQWTRGNKLILEEHYVDGRRHGSYVRYIGDGSSPELEGQFVDGERDGLWKRYEEGSLVATETWRAGVLEGPAVEYLSGVKAAETTYVAGAQTGTRTLFYSDGEKRAEGPMLDGKREGRWTYWKSDRSVNEAWSGLYANDERVGD